jgi:hypothetical protein
MTNESYFMYGVFFGGLGVALIWVIHDFWS